MANQGVLEKMKKGIQESDRCFHDENDDDEDKWLKVIKLLGFTNKYTKYDDFVYTHTHIYVTGFLREHTLHIMCVQ